MHSNSTTADNLTAIAPKHRISLPVYTKGEERFNAISHIVGGGLGVLFAVIASIVAAQNPTAEKIVAIVIYAFSIITLYTMSALYHFLPNGKAKRVFRVFDHCTIYLLIAGCYTPFCLILFWTEPLGKIIFFTEWGLAVVGIALNAVAMDHKAVKTFSHISYVVMGWMVVFAFPSLLAQTSIFCVAFLLAGGICYTVGILFYALGKKKKYMHSVWHLFVLAGSILQFVSILTIL